MVIPWVSRHRLREQSERAMALADENRVLRSQLEEARAAASAAAKEARDSVRMVADWMAERQFGTKIYDTAAPPLPPDEPTAAALDRYNTTAGRARARDVVREAERRFNAQLRALEMTPATPDA